MAGIEKAIALSNAVTWQWEVQYACFMNYPPLSSLSEAEAAAAAVTLHPSLTPYWRKRCRGGVWISTSTSSVVTLKLLADRSTGSGDAVLSLSFLGKLMEEHYISQVCFSWPQVSCVSGFPARGTRTVFLSYKDRVGQANAEICLAVLRVQETEKFIDVVKEILEFEELSNAEFRSELSSQSEFVPSNGLSYRAEEDNRHTIPSEISIHQMPARFEYEVMQRSDMQEAIPVSADICTHQISASLNYEAEQHSNRQQAIPNCDAEQITSVFSPSSRQVPVGLIYEVEQHSDTQEAIPVSADIFNHQMPASLNYEAAQHLNTQEAIPNRAAEEIISSFPPSFSSFLMNCFPAVEIAHPNATEIDLKSQITRYLEDSSFQDMLIKVEEVINNW